MNDEIIINGEKYVKADTMATEDGLVWCVVRCDRSGAFAALVDYERMDDKLIVMRRARRLWYWDGASSLSELAVKGVSRPENCKFPCEVYEMKVTDCIECIPMTDKAVESVASVAVWTQHE